MSCDRRRLVLMMAATTALVSARSFAQAYPSRPVRVIVPVAAGGANDTTARLFAQKLSEHLGQQFYVENVPGAGGNLGIPDAYAFVVFLLVVLLGWHVVWHLYKRAGKVKGF